jgi:hypothetical protein
MAALAPGNEANAAGKFLAGGDAEVSDLAIGHLGGAAFVEGELAAELVPIAFAEGVHAGRGDGLFTGFGQEDGVSRELPSAAVKLQHRLQCAASGLLS